MSGFSYNEVMECNIINQTQETKYEQYYPEIQHYFEKALKDLEMPGDYDISLILVGPEEIHEINRQYRKIDRETDVISFAEIDGEAGFDVETDEPIYLGDIFINIDRVVSQAKEYEHSEEREFIFLFIHGVLHCLGYDHMTKEDEEVMIAKQKLILGDLK